MYHICIAWTYRDIYRVYLDHLCLGNLLQQLPTGPLTLLAARRAGTAWTRPGVRHCPCIVSRRSVTSCRARSDLVTFHNSALVVACHPPSPLAGAGQLCNQIQTGVTLSCMSSSHHPYPCYQWRQCYVNLPPIFDQYDPVTKRLVNQCCECAEKSWKLSFLCNR